MMQNNESILKIDWLAGGSGDFEKKQYQVLGSLKSIRTEFRNNRIYPHLASLIELKKNIGLLLKGFSSIRQDGPRRIKSIDLDKKLIQFESELPEELNLEAVKKFIEWAQPFIDEAIHEGIKIYDFVEENLSLQQVGISPGYTDEGYFFLPNTAKNTLQLFRYELSIYTSSQERFRSLKTTLIREEDLGSGLTAHPSEIKLSLIKEFADLPNPATYAFQTQLDFPFEKTILPIAKRKLISQLIS
ncbi:MAG: hypothetical protein LAT67_07860 [Balneolales bacterium]|nr:hypothetical protein [Balneolales bacterium]